jgi:AcrR family transcriptional regulator
MTELVRPYRGVSAADRQADRRGRLLDACLTVVGRDGVAATTVGAVCQEAGLIKRYFYESFPDLDSMLVELFDGFQATLLGEIRRALGDAGADPIDRARVTVALLVAAMDDPRIARLFVEASAHPRLNDLRQDAYNTYTALVASDILADPHPTAEQRLAALVFVTGTTQAVISWLSGGVDLTRDALIDELARLAVARRT